MKAAVSKARLRQPLGHYEWRSSVLGKDDKTLPSIEMSMQMLNGSTDQRDQIRLGHRPPESRTSKREGGNMRNDTELVCCKVTRKRNSHSVKHRIAASEYRHAFLSTIFRKDQLKG